jgi:hypothetical protein
LTHNSLITLARERVRERKREAEEERREEEESPISFSPTAVILAFNSFFLKCPPPPLPPFLAFSSLSFDKAA